MPENKIAVPEVRPILRHMVRKGDWIYDTVDEWFREAGADGVPPVPLQHSPKDGIYLIAKPAQAKAYNDARRWS